MSSPVTVFAGLITDDGIVLRLAEIEDRQTTGAIHFSSEGVEGEVALVRGQFAAEQSERPDGKDPVELLLELRSGRFEVIQRLPPLPVSTGDAQMRTGSLAVHVTADLMNYCETAGLTGFLTLAQDDRIAEILYERGEMIGIRLDGEDDEDLNEVFGWDRGSFRLELIAEAPDLETLPSERPLTAPPPAQGAAAAPSVHPPVRILPARPLKTDTTGVQFLRVVEKSLTSILDEREQHRPTDRVGPEMVPLPEPAPLPARAATERPLPLPASRSKPRRDATVRVIYLGGGTEPASPSPVATPIVAASARSVETPASVDSDDTNPEILSFDDRPTTEMVAPSSRHPSSSTERDAEEAAPPDAAPPEVAAAPGVGAVAWAVLALTLALGALGVLAHLPVLE